MPLWKRSRCEPSVVLRHWGETGPVYPDGDITPNADGLRSNIRGISLITLLIPALKVSRWRISSTFSEFCSLFLNLGATVVPDKLLLSPFPSDVSSSFPTKSDQFKNQAVTSTCFSRPYNMILIFSNCIKVELFLDCDSRGSIVLQFRRAQTLRRYGRWHFCPN